jgi:AcrR family transcriptional regulator
MTDELRRRSPRQRLSRAEKKEQTRRRLLESAHAVIALKGYEGASIDEIAEDAGYSRGAFYSNFSGKQEIMSALINSGFDSDFDSVGAMAAMEGLEEVEAAFREFAKQNSDDPENTLWSLEFQLAAVRHPELRADYSRQYNKLRDSVRSILVETMRSLGHNDPEAAGRFADVVIVIVNGLSMTKLLYPDTFDDSVFGDALMAVVRGIPGAPEPGATAT